MANMVIDNGLKAPDLIGGKTQLGATPASRFADALSNAVDGVNRLQNSADKAVQNVQSDNSASLHEAMIALEKADISFRTMLQVRNKVIEAYQEVMRMQV